MEQKKYNIKFNSSICCDLCMETTREYLNVCPICNTTNAPTDILESAYYFKLRNDELGVDSTFNCCDCNSTFKLVAYDYPDGEVELFKHCLSDIPGLAIGLQQAKDGNVKRMSFVEYVDIELDDE